MGAGVGQGYGFIDRGNKQRIAGDVNIALGNWLCDRLQKGKGLCARICQIYILSHRGEKRLPCQRSKGCLGKTGDAEHLRHQRV